MEKLPKIISIAGALELMCKYGENAYQTPAALYSTGSDDPLALDKFVLISGQPPSYNNLCDLDRLLQTGTHIVATFDINRGGVPYIALGVKHGNSCGASIAPDKETVIRNMIIGDDLALFGGLTWFNFYINEELAELLLTYNLASERRLLDGIIAPGFDEKAIELLKRKKDKCRLIANPALAQLDRNSLDQNMRFRYVRGGFLVQPNYTFILRLDDPDLKKYGEATVEQEDAMLLGKAISDTQNSNTVTIIHKFLYLIGNGVGQQARVRGAQLGVNQTIYNNHDADSASGSSDSFFPQKDGPKVLAEAGLKAIIATSGSVKDEEVIQFCQDKGIVLYLIPDPKGRGFFGH